jgi:YVTN family beta-propeller protein
MFPAGAVGAELIRDGAPVYAYVFNVQSKDVTVIDTATNEVLETRPLGASVRWLSNEQDFWDGRYIWTYDIVEKMVHLIAVDPVEMRVVHSIEIGKGPAHSVQITPDRKHVLVNAAGDNFIAVVGRESLKVEQKIATGEWPCDIDFSPDGKMGYVPERDQHTVASFDLASFEIVGRGSLAEGSKPHMLRVAPDGNSIWVQTAAGGTNDVLDPMTLKIRVSEKLGKVPVSNAWAPDGRYAYVTHFKDNYVSVLDAKTFREIGRIPVGQGGANVAFSPDGAFAYVTLVGENKVAVIDTARMEVVKKIAAGSKPWGLVIMSPPEPG